MPRPAPSTCRLLAAALLSLGLAACAAESGPGGQPLVSGLPEEPDPPVCPVPMPEELAGAPLTLVSFTIDDLGVYSKRDNEALACLVGLYDLVVPHGLGAPPYAHTFADGEAYRPSAAAAQFFDTMRLAGYEYVMAPEDTGHVPTNRLNSGLTTWPVVFYKPDRLRVAQDRPSGYIEPDRTANPNFDRVPFAVAFQTIDGRYDFMVVSVELAEGREKASRRRFELSALTGWLSKYASNERDVYISGGFDFADCSEIGALPPALTWSDAGCRPTDVALKRPSDGWLVLEGGNGNIWGKPAIVNIIAEMQPFWFYKEGPDYPGDPLNQLLFNSVYAGSRPVVLPIAPPPDDVD